MIDYANRSMYHGLQESQARIEEAQRVAHVGHWNVAGVGPDAEFRIVLPNGEVRIVHALTSSAGVRCLAIRRERQQDGPTDH